jgi:hypothetical protein
MLQMPRDPEEVTGLEFSHLRAGVESIWYVPAAERFLKCPEGAYRQ